MQRLLIRTAAVCGAGLLALSSSSCALASAQGRTAQLDPDRGDNLGGTGPESGDLRGASEQIARAVTALDTPAPPTIALAAPTNQTRFRMDPLLLRNKLTHDLVSRGRGRFTIVPLDDDTPTATADLLLKTEIRSLTRDNGDAKSDYIQYAFTLERPTDGAVVWAGMFETKRQSRIDILYQ
jgi:hypothetical protein